MIRQRDYSSEFPLRDDIIYLNHAAVSPWPLRTADAVYEFTQQNLTQGSLFYPQWLETESMLREQMRQLINAPSTTDIALVKNTSEALSIVAYGLDWQHGENIVSSDQEFPSNRIVWESLATKGVELRQADLSAAETPEDSLFALVDTNTRLIAISSVQYASGLRMDLERIGAFCRERGILFCVDAIQSLGVLPFDVMACHADFVAADGHKWMLGPEGLGVFYCRAEMRDRLELNQYGWHMVEALGDFDQQSWQPAASARRFECGSPNMLGVHALSASLSLLLETGMAVVSDQILDNSRYLMEALGQLGYLLATPLNQTRHAGIVSFRHPQEESTDLFDYLRENGVFCALRNGNIRFSPHFYTPRQQLERSLELLESYR
jgi:cysteine desulfurase / selenocysteine lyase